MNRGVIVLASALVAPATSRADEPQPGPFAEPELPYLASTIDARDVGPFSPADNLVPRAVCLKLGERTSACFDTDLLRMAVAWRGEFLSEKGIAGFSYRSPRRKAEAGERDLPKPLGEVIVATGLYPGCVELGTPVVDPRPPGPDPAQLARGPLPRARGRWKGLYLHGPRATLAYSLGGSDIWEQDRAIAGGVARVLRISPSGVPCRLVLAELPPKSQLTFRSARKLVVRTGPARLAVTVTPPPPPGALKLETGRYVTLAMPRPGSKSATFRVDLQQQTLDRSGPAPAPRVARLEPLVPGTHTPARWPETVVTRVRRDALEAEGFAVDDLTLPEPNPWRRRVRPSGIAFFPDGRAVVATIDGDIWIVSGLDDSSRELAWRRFASGLSEPQSVVVREGEIFTFTREGIVRLRDLDQDGEADFYESFCNLAIQTAETREYAMDMVLRPDGGFFIAKGGQRSGALAPHSGSILSITPDGRNVQAVATGLRQPYLGIHPTTGLLTASDQEGNWIPSSPLHIVQAGAFYGHRTGLPGEDRPVTEPLLWLPHQVVPSAAGQVWVTGARMGPLEGRLLYLDYTRAGLVEVSLGEPQAAARRIPLVFPAATLKAAMSAADRWLYVVGFQIYDSRAERLGGFFRVRYTGKPAVSLAEARAVSEGFLLRFRQPLPAGIGGSPGAFTARRWNYKRTASYGSGFYKLDGSPGQEQIVISRVRLSRDRTMVFLSVPDMRPAMQMEVSYRLQTSTGRDIADSVYLTASALHSADIPEGDLHDVTMAAPATERRPPAPPATAAWGAEVAARLSCLTCHSTDGTTDGRTGPTWKGLFGSKRRLSDGSEVVADEGYLRRSIASPEREVVERYADKEVGMPSYAGVITETELSALVLFIRSLAGR